jgi:hypothetical protein
MRVRWSHPADEIPWYESHELVVGEDTHLQCASLYWIKVSTLSSRKFQIEHHEQLLHDYSVKQRSQPNRSFIARPQNKLLHVMDPAHTPFRRVTFPKMSRKQSL